MTSSVVITHILSGNMVRDKNLGGYPGDHRVEKAEVISFPSLTKGIYIGPAL